MYFLGIDLGSSSIKLALVESQTGISHHVVKEPQEEMSISAKHKGWAEQDPNTWWRYVCNGVKTLIDQKNISPKDIQGIGISYQMHGLVLLDENGAVLRDSIIWCDSRAVANGNKAYADLGADFCDTNLLNSPGNFTASKLRWVKENEPDTYARIHKILWPGDYIAYQLSGEMNTTVSGLSEGILWNFQKKKTAHKLLDYYEINEALVPELVDTFSKQGEVSRKGALESGLLEGTPIFYRAGDQPNNALSLNVFHPGEVAATGGTSGVLYAITDNLSAKECARVNNFAHVNYGENGKQLIGKLLCINGAGIQYRWLLNNLSVDSYEAMNALASKVAIGSDGLRIFPYGNGAERMFGNKDFGTHIAKLDLNRHDKSHLCRAALEGIAFSFAYGYEILKSDGIQPKIIRAGNDNLFRSEIFSQTLANLMDSEIEIYDTTGAIGAARACILKDGDYKKYSGFVANDYVGTFKPKEQNTAYDKAYEHWKKELHVILKTTD